MLVLKGCPQSFNSSSQCLHSISRSKFLFVFLAVFLEQINLILFIHVNQFYTGELKQAIVSMMLKKDEIEEQNRCVLCSIKPPNFRSSGSALNDRNVEYTL